MPLPCLYVSGPMAGYPELNFPAFFEAARKLRAAGFEVCNPAEVALPCGCSGGSVTCGGYKHEWQEYLRSDLVAMLECADAIATLPGWENSKGAQLEIHVATKLWWKVQPVGHWLGEALIPALRPGSLLRAKPGMAPPPPPEYRISNPAPING